jgi:predicted AAA+ superfamily ATPase
MGVLTEDGYRPRLIDEQIAEALESFGAVSIEGPKFCGKTWTALNHAASVFYVMDPEGNYANRQLARMNPSLAIQGGEPRLIDEWQVAPGVWDAVRFAVDREKRKGRFILTGSSTPIKEKPVHSGAGRVAKVFLRPLTLFESGDSDGAVSLRGLFESEPVVSGLPGGGLEVMARLCVRGGWPENIDAPQGKAMRMPAQYVRVIETSDISEPDGVPRDPQKVAALLRALARNNATMVKNTALKYDVAQAGMPVSTPTIASYLTACKQIFILEEIGGWVPDARAKARVRTSPKRYLVDPSLVCAILGVSASKLLTDMPLFGQVFEGLCVRDLQVYAWAMDAVLKHYHDDDGLEVDAIIERRDGSYAAVEIRLATGHEDVAAASLSRFAAKLTAKQARPPEFLMIITGGGIPYRRQDGIVVVPITSLRS